MKKSIRFLAAVLSLLLLSALIPFGVFAYGTSDNRLIITHINTSPSYEGAAIIASGTKYSKAGALGNFAWWLLAVFDWDSAQGCYVVQSVQTQTGQNMDKSATPIPVTGFAYGICIGNDYSASGGINYKTQRVIDSYALTSALKVGDKAYLYDVDLGNGIIITNGKLWYEPEFTSDSYIKIGTPDEGKTPYDPNSATAIGFSVVPNGINNVRYEAGASLIFDASQGRTVPVTVAKYQWWYSAVFDWDDENGCYVVISIDRLTGNSYPKQPIIPENGFVLVDCGANTSSLNNIAVGDMVWLYDIDLKNGTLGSEPVIRFVLPLEGKTAYTPVIASPRLKTPVINESVLGIINAPSSGITVSWNAVEGATGYYVALNDGSACVYGDVIIAPELIKTNSYSIPSSALEVGNTYTLSVYAVAEGKGTGMVSVSSVKCISDSAINSSLKDKTIVAFGDSLTARTGYVKMLYGYIGTEVINSGVGGNNTNHAKARFDDDVLAYDPDIVLICFGMNDQACNLATKQPGISLETYRSNLEYFAKTLTEKGVDVIFVTPNPINTNEGYYVPGEYGLDYAYGFADGFVDAMRQVAIEYNCGLVDIYYECEFEDLNKFIAYGDGIHQTAYGHQRFAELISDYLLARYDGEDKAEMTVNCLDSESNVIKTVTYIGKAGAHITLAAPEIEGLSTSEDIRTVFTDGASFTFTYTSAVEYVIGDVSGDGKITALDYQLLKRAVLKTYNLDETQTLAGDINGDGKITALDYQLLKRAVLGTYIIK